MSEIPDLFNEPAIPQHSEEVGESKSSGSKSSAWIIGLISLGLVGSAGVTAYYGLGPMLAKPYQPPVNSQAPDIATVLGIGDAQLPQGLEDSYSQEQKQQLLESVNQVANLPQSETQVAILRVIQNAPPSLPLLKNAQINDAAFIFTEARQAFLYRPSTQELVAADSF